MGCQHPARGKAGCLTYTDMYNCHQKIDNPLRRLRMQNSVLAQDLAWETAPRRGLGSCTAEQVSHMEQEILTVRFAGLATPFVTFLIVFLATC